MALNNTTVTVPVHLEFAESLRAARAAEPRQLRRRLQQPRPRRGITAKASQHGEIRSALYMAAVSASRWNPALRPFYQRLLQRGAAKKKALIAVARKLLAILNAIVRDGKPWRAPCPAEL